MMDLEINSEKIPPVKLMGSRGLNSGSYPQPLLFFTTSLPSSILESVYRQLNFTIWRQNVLCNIQISQCFLLFFTLSLQNCYYDFAMADKRPTPSKVGESSAYLICRNGTETC